MNLEQQDSVLSNFQPHDLEYPDTVSMTAIVWSHGNSFAVTSILQVETRRSQRVVKGGSWSSTELLSISGYLFLTSDARVGHKSVLLRGKTILHMHLLHVLAQNRTSKMQFADKPYLCVNPDGNMPYSAEVSVEA